MGQIFDYNLDEVYIFCLEGDWMGLQKDEIIDLASRYVDVTRANFPYENDLFYFLMRKVPDNKVLKENEGWQFTGYGQITEYVLDTEAKPLGKWIFMYYLDFTRFPLEEQSLKLQPPHIVNGMFHSADRSFQIKMVKCLRPSEIPEDHQPAAFASGESGSSEEPDNIIPFPKREP